MKDHKLQQEGNQRSLTNSGSPNARARSLPCFDDRASGKGRFTRSQRCIAAGVCVLLQVWIGYQVLAPRDLDKLVFTRSGPNEDARSTVDRMLKVNRPWLEPRPLKATYSLNRKVNRFSILHGVRRAKQVLGPYSIVPGCKPSLRVGSIISTPLHAMLATSNNYVVRMLGSTTWKGRKVVAIEATFASPIACFIGMGGQGAEYSSAGSEATNVLFLIDSVRTVPLLIRTSSTLKVSPVSAFLHETVWEFGPHFFELDGGLAPQALSWRDNFGVFKEYQEFQLVEGAWIFKKGKAVLPLVVGGPSKPGLLARAMLLIGGDLYSTQALEMVAFRLATAKQG